MVRIKELSDGTVKMRHIKNSKRLPGAGTGKPAAATVATTGSSTALVSALHQTKENMGVAWRAGSKKAIVGTTRRVDVACKIENGS